MRIQVPPDFAAHAHELTGSEWAAKLGCSKNAVLSFCRANGLKTAGIRRKPPFPFPDDFRERVQDYSVRATAKHYGASVKDVTAHCRRLGIDLSWKKGGSKKGEKRKKRVPKYETQEMIKMCLSCGERRCDEGICKKIRAAWEEHLEKVRRRYNEQETQKRLFADADTACGGADCGSGVCGPGNAAPH